MQNPYWATLQGEELVAALKERFENFERGLSSSGDLDRMEVAAREYFGQDESGNSTSRPEKAGSQDQLRVLKTGHFRSVVQTKLTLAKADTPAFIPVAANTDEKSQAQTLLSKGLLQYEMEEGGVEGVVDGAVEAAEVLGWSVLAASWDENAGEVAETLPVLGEVAENGVPSFTIQENRTGEPKLRAYLPTDAAFNLGGRGEPQWWILRDWQNKHDVAAELVKLGRQAEADDASGLVAEITTRIRDAFGWSDNRDTDEVPVYEFRHAKTPAVPGGRCVRFLSSGIILKDGPLPYQDLAVRHVKSSARFGTPRGYASSHDILGLQKAVDVITSISYSNARTLGGSYIWAPEGSPLTATKLSEGLTLLKGGNQSMKPEAINLLRPGPELRELRAEYTQEMGTLQGLDSLSMGTEERQLSGAAMALLDTRTQRAVSKLAGLRVDSLKWAANQCLRLYRDFAAYSRRLPLVVGKTKQPMLREFSRDDVAGIDRVMVQTASPLMKQPSGRLEVATQLKGMKDATGGPAINAEQFMAVLETGQLEPMTEGPMMQLMTIRSENERLAQGEVLDSPPPMLDATGMPFLDPKTGLPPPQVATALQYDNHPLHIQEHLTVLGSTEARANPAIIDAVNNHIAAHVTLWRSADPDVLAAINVPLPMSTQAMMDAAATMPPAPGAASGTAPPESGGLDATASGGQSPDMPSLPTNPATGEEYAPTAEVQA